MKKIFQFAVVAVVATIVAVFYVSFSQRYNNIDVAAKNIHSQAVSSGIDLRVDKQIIPVESDSKKSLDSVRANTIKTLATPTSVKPSVRPTAKPTKPTPTARPSPVPTAVPTPSPSTLPTFSPTDTPPSSSPSSEPSSAGINVGQFGILSLSNSSLRLIAASNLGIGADTVGGLAVFGQYVSYYAVTGTKGTAIIDPGLGILTTNPISNLNNISGPLQGLASNLKTGDYFLLTNNFGQGITGSGGFISQIQYLLPDQFGKVYKVIPLTVPIRLGPDSAIFSGYDRVVLVDGDTGKSYNIYVGSTFPGIGHVNILGKALRRWAISDSRLSWGIAEFSYLGETNLVYGNMYGVIERQSLDEQNHHVVTLYNPGPYGLGDLTMFSLDFTNNKWIFYYRGKGAFGNYSEGVVGVADAQLMRGLPSSMPSGRPSANPTQYSIAKTAMGLARFESSNVVYFNASKSIGNGGITGVAVAGSSILISGPSNTISIPASLTSSVGQIIRAAVSPVLASDTYASKVFTLADANLKPLTPSGGLVYCLIPIDVATAQPISTSGSVIYLKMPVRIAPGSAILSGYNRIVIVDGDTYKTYEIQVTSGAVTFLGRMLPEWAVSSSGLSYGFSELLEYYSTHAVVYGNRVGIIERQYMGVAGTAANVPIKAQSAVDPIFTPLFNGTQLAHGIISTVALDPVRRRWYFASTSEVIGSADAIVELSFPSSRPTCQPSSMPTSSTGLEKSFFSIDRLSSSKLYTLELGSILGDDSIGGIALASKGVIFTGGSTSVQLSKTFVGTSSILNTYSNPIMAIASEYRRNFVYVLADAKKNPISGAGDVITYLLWLDPILGIASNAVYPPVPLSQTIKVGSDSAIFSGYDRIMFVNGDNGKIYSIFPIDGKVTYVGKALTRWTLSDSELVWGVNEFSYNDHVSIDYGCSTGIERQSIISPQMALIIPSTTEQIFSGGRLGLGDLTSFTVDMYNYLWYFSYRGSGAFGNFTHGVGYAQSFLALSEPSSLPTGQPSSMPTTSTGVVAHVFAINHLTTSSRLTVNVSSSIGNDTCSTGMIVSSNRLILTGCKSTLSLDKTTLNGPAVSHPMHAMTMNIDGLSAYQLLDVNSAPITGNGGSVAYLQQMNQTGPLRNRKFPLVQCRREHQCKPFSFPIGPNSLILAGWDRIIVACGATGKTHNIFIARSNVAYLGKVQRRWVMADGELTFGVSEFSIERKVTLIYGTPGGAIERQIVGGSTSTTNYESLFTDTRLDLGDIPSLTVDPTINKWYFYSSIVGRFANFSSVAGSADAVFSFYYPTGQPSQQPTVVPTQQPSSQPSSEPTSPTSQPTRRPSGQPSSTPTDQPSLQPTCHPSSQPSKQPVSLPSGQPSVSPASQPSAQPSRHPTCQPTGSPSSQPSRQPTRRPSAQPSRQPTRRPTGQPSCQPSRQPTRQPSRLPTGQPSRQPSRQPSSQPSRRPSGQPTLQPSRQPSSQPTRYPTGQPSRQPTRRPSSQPTRQPSRRPTSQPSCIPSGQPSRQPTRRPTGQPSRVPTMQPSRQPTRRPTGQPSRQPTRQPSRQPSRRPTMQPTTQPSLQPSLQPSRQPTSTPTTQPTSQPSSIPSSQPAVIPSVQPTSKPSTQPSRQPSNQPSGQPSRQPSLQPSMQPSSQPSPKPSRQPSSQPSSKPTRQPTSQPSKQPSRHPSCQPSRQPSSQPSRRPSRQPTSQPTRQPSSQPTMQPSRQPTSKPTRQPSLQPTFQPSMQPISQPTSQPSAQPASSPSCQPTAQPSSRPSMQPYSSPTSQPSLQPSMQPSRVPTSQPSLQPSRQPSSQPSRQPTSQPSMQPSRQPAGYPSMQPSRQPSSQPSRQPTSQPTRQPSSQPTSQPSRQPFCRPTGQPSRQPTSQPSRQPSRQPSSQPTRRPSSQPSRQPSRNPSSQPSNQPMGQPSSRPSRVPTSQPSLQPSRQPSSQPTRQPFMRPTGQPSRHPSTQPTRQPSNRPSKAPSNLPSGQPSAQPRSRPTSRPTRQPTQQPTLQPSRQPTRRPSRQPTRQPTSQPSRQPLSRPTGQPTRQPTSQPSRQPISQPTSQPSRNPTSQPSLQPTRQPTSQPSRQPISQPTSQPSSQPTRLPTKQPTSQPSSCPTKQPTSRPSSQPTAQPSIQPSSQPTKQPTSKPTQQPTSVPSSKPSTQPSSRPTNQPSKIPTSQPSSQPSSKPTGQPSVIPTSQPSARPTVQPSHQPTEVPTSQPSLQPSEQPTSQPSNQPTCIPSCQPTDQPTSDPSIQPSTQPSSQPSLQPTDQPTVDPTMQPSSQPTRQPSSRPSCKPSKQPTSQPTREPTRQPSSQPSKQPTQQPTSEPSIQPSLQPTQQPSEQPTSQPSKQPSSQPTNQPSSQPTAQPSLQPTSQPSRQPTSQPSSQPTSRPTDQPTVQPTSFPTNQPTSRPSTQPSSQPTTQPSRQPTSKPSTQPTSQPSGMPTVQPTSQPSLYPTSQPSSKPSVQPSSQPTVHPTTQPTGSPSIQPISQPSSQPSSHPSCQPSSQPTRQPISQPSQQPTRKPSAQPSRQPTSRPTSQPSRCPSAQPSRQPTRLPTTQPTRQPISQPTSQPSRKPTGQPSRQPSRRPTSQPSRVPSRQPTSKPSRVPTAQPSFQPSSQPSGRPSSLPTTQPSIQPSRQPVSRPSSNPSSQPSSKPSRVPTMKPSGQPSRQPTSKPSLSPSVQPSSKPSRQPSRQPTRQPSSQPTRQPVRRPTAQPSQRPTSQPSTRPSRVPTSQPTRQPFNRPTTQPTRAPFGQPTSRPSRRPTGQPSRRPSRQPHSRPSNRPSAQPYSHPSCRPSSQPSVSPSTEPTLRAAIVIFTVSTDVTQTLSGVSAASFQDPTTVTAFTQTVIELLTKTGIVNPTVSGFKASRRRRLFESVFGRALQSSSSVTLRYTVTATATGSAGAFTNLLMSGLNAGIGSGNFTSTLQTYASALGATSLSGASASVTASGKQLSIVKTVITPSPTASPTSQPTGMPTSPPSTALYRISFISSPRSVYGSLSTYARSTANIFSFRVQVAPQQSIIVRPTLNGTFSSSAGVRLIPDAFSFTSASSASELIGEFVLSAAPTVTANFVLGLNVTGPSLGMYFDTTSVNVIVLGSQSTAPPPILASAKFGNGGSIFYFTFNTPTDFANMTSSATWPCNKLFKFSAAASASCGWVNPTVVQGTYGSFGGLTSSMNLVIVGSSVALLPKKVRVACVPGTSCSANPAAPGNTVKMLPPATAFPPVIVFNVQSTISICDNLVMDVSASTGNYGRRWLNTTRWLVTVSDNSLSSISSAGAITNFLNNATNFFAPIVIPNKLLNPTTYTFRFGAQNFFGDSVVGTVPVTVSSNGYVPQAIIPGTPYTTINVANPLSLTGVAQLSACTNAANFTLAYIWIVEKNGSAVLGLNSTSRNPRNLLLPAYSLTPDVQPYKVTLQVLAASNGTVLGMSTYSVSVTVNTGPVVAVVSGGSTKSSPIDATLVLDGSASVDRNYAPGSRYSTSIAFSWSCQLGNVNQQYGQPCGLFGSFSTVNTRVLRVAPYTLASNLTYIFTLRVTASDGRYGSQSVTVVTSPPKSVFVGIASASLKANPTAKFTLQGTLQANYSVAASWSVRFGAVATAPTALTPVSTVFSRDLASRSIAFPLAYGPSTFVAGRLYNFRLTGCSTASQLTCSFSEVSVQFNVLPYGGFVQSSPVNGTALSTIFTVSTSNWLTDVSSYPLYYAFSYQASPTAPVLSIQSNSLLTSAKTILPAGSNNLNYQVQVLTTVSDINGGTANASRGVRVMLNAQPDLKSVLTSALQSVAVSSNVGALNQAINVVASTLNYQDCSKLPNSCSSLKRNACGTGGPNLCGSCMTGYTGVVGASNTACSKAGKTAGPIGSSCVADTDCLYGLCESGICASPSQPCPSNSPDNVCSNHGSCAYFDTVGQLLSMTCIVFDTNCMAKCMCDTGYGGADCSLNSTKLASIDNSRTSLCLAISSSITLQDLTPQLVDSVTSSLLSSFAPDQVVSAAGIQACAKVMSFLSSAASQGLLTGTQPSTIQYYAQIVSGFVNQSASNASYALVEDAITSLSGGVFSGMVGAERPTTIVSSGVRLRLLHPPVSSLANATLTPPPLLSEAAYGTALPGIVFPGAGLSVCGFAGEYAQVSIMQWGSNPYGDVAAEKVQSNVLRLASSGLIIPTAPPTAKPSPRPSLNPSLNPTPLPSALSAPTSATRELLDAISFDQHRSPAYFLTFPFSSRRSFNMSSLSSNFRKMNLTMPACTYFDGEKYVPCSGCNISSFSEYNVTFACFDLSALCGTEAAQISRRLQALMTMGAVHSDPQPDLVHVDASKHLTNVAVYGAKEVPLIAIMPPVIPNPVINYTRGLPVLAFFSALLFTILVGIVWFLRWDAFDASYAIYLRKQSMRSSRVMSRSPRSPIPSYLDGVYLPRRSERSVKTALDPASTLNPLAASELTDSLAPDQSVNLGEEVNVVSDSFSEGLLTDFLSDVFPSERLNLRPTQDSLGRIFLESDGDLNVKYWKDLYLEHPWTTMWCYYSAGMSRTIRWIALARGWLLSIFMQSVFFRVVYPDGGFCNALPTRVDCLVAQSLVPGGGTVCQWNPHTRLCSLIPPPADILFNVNVALMSICSVIVIDFFYGLITEKYASKMPAFISASAKKNSTPANSEDGAIPVVGDVYTEYAPLREFYTYNNVDQKTRTLIASEIDAMANLAFDDFRSAEAELNFILEAMKQFIADDVESQQAGNFDPRKELTMRAMIKRLKMSPQGDQRSLFDIVFKRTPYQKLLYELNNTRLTAQNIKNEIMELVYDGYCDHRDALLMQYFVLENVPGVFKFALRKHLFKFKTYLDPGAVNSLIWFLSWTFLLATWYVMIAVVYIIWTRSEGLTLFPWGLVLAISTIEDALLIQPARIYITNVVAIGAIAPQLRAIHRTLHVIATAYIQDGLDRNTELRVVQHFNAACRVARMEATYRLPAAYILRQIDDVDADACRKDRNRNIGRLAYLSVWFPSLANLINENFASGLAEFFVAVSFTCFIVLNLFLYYLGAIFIAAPYLIITGYWVYHHGLLRPSLRRVQAIKVAKRDGIKNWRQSKRTAAEPTLQEWLAKAGGSVLDWLATQVYIITKPIVSFDVVDETENFELVAMTNRWKFMNSPGYCQGKIATEEDLAEEQALLEEEEAGVAVPLPFEIKAMSTQLFSVNDDGYLRAKGSDAYISKTVFGTKPLMDAFAEAANDKAVHFSDFTSERTMKFRAALETTDVFVALARMLMPLGSISVSSLATLRSDEEYVMKHLGQAGVDDSIVVEELRPRVAEIWDVFYPDGCVLSSTDRIGVQNKFDRWLESTKDFKSQADVTTVRFSSFVKWFIQLSKIIVAERQAQEDRERRAKIAAMAGISSDADDESVSAGAASSRGTSTSGFASTAFSSNILSSATSLNPLNWMNFFGSSESSSRGERSAAQSDNSEVQWADMLSSDQEAEKEYETQVITKTQNDAESQNVEGAGEEDYADENDDEYEEEEDEEEG